MLKTNHIQIIGCLLYKGNFSLASTDFGSSEVPSSSQTPEKTHHHFANLNISEKESVFDVRLRSLMLSTKASKKVLVVKGLHFKSRSLDMCVFAFCRMLSVVQLSRR